MDELTLVVRGHPVRCVVERAGEEFVVRTSEATYRIRLVELEPGVLRVVAEGRTQTVRIARDNTRRFLHLDGWTLEYTVAASGEPGSGAPHAAHEDLTAPMPGGVTQVLVRRGERVTVGQPLVIVEAMKMEHVIRAPRPGRITALRVREGDQVDGGAVVVEIDWGSPPEGEPR